MVAAARTALLAVLAALILTGVSAAQPSATRAGPAAAVAAGPDGDRVPAVESFRSPRSYPTVAVPVRIRIPALGVDSRLDRVGRAADGSIAVPRRTDVAAWYARGPRPGQPGPAVIVGHVDSRNGPGVFFAAHRLTAGAAIHVDRSDGSTVTFQVRGVSRVPKDRFPTDEVYSPTLRPGLRLVTCGGTFDQRRRSYRDNVIVFAVPA